MKGNPWKKPNESEFCVRNTFFREQCLDGKYFKYYLDDINISKEGFRSKILNSNCKDLFLDLRIDFYSDGTFNLIITNPNDKRFDPSKYSLDSNNNLRKLADIHFIKLKADIKGEADTKGETDVKGETESKGEADTKGETETKVKEYTEVTWESSRVISVIKEINTKINLKCQIIHNPVQINLFYGEKFILTINDRQLLNYESQFKKPELSPAIRTIPWDAVTAYAISKGTIENLIPKYEDDDGKTYYLDPNSVGIDFTLHDNDYSYGLAERYHSYRIGTKKEELFRIFNKDGFWQDAPFASTYGCTPYIQCYSKDYALSLSWINSSDTYVFMERPEESNKLMSHWFSEGGSINALISVGNSPRDLLYSYMAHFGRITMPKITTLGYHQCRWNYWSTGEVMNLSQLFMQTNLPCDQIWLDIGFSQNCKYFHFDINRFFLNQENMLETLKKHHRNLTVIVDPHLKVDPNLEEYKVVKENKLAILNPDKATLYEAKCWPAYLVYLDSINENDRLSHSHWDDFMKDKAGLAFSVWFDFLNENARKYWADLIYKCYGSRGISIWNDMNEPAVFNTSLQDKTVPKAMLHTEGTNYYTHRDVHNIYGLLNVIASYEGLIQDSKRPFILTRSFFSGVHRYAAVWTGDAECNYNDMKINLSMLFGLSMSGIVNCGADIPGFFGNATEDLAVRGYQFGTFMPFMRAHAGNDSKNREPWFFNEYENIKKAILLRYKLIPYIYSLFYEAYLSLVPLIRPMWIDFPGFGFDIEDQFMFGYAFLIKPIFDKAFKSIPIKFPPNTIWYDYFNKFTPIQVDTIEYTDNSLERFPLYIKGGSIFWTWNLPQKFNSTQELLKCNISIVIALNKDNEAEGFSCIDDGQTFDYKEKSKYDLILMKFKDLAFTSKFIFYNFQWPVNLEKIEILGCALPNIQSIERNKRVLVFDQVKHENMIKITFLEPITACDEFDLIFKIN